MRARLTIASRGDGWTDRIETVAQMRSEGGYAVVEYEIDGDPCVLRVSKDSLEQTRCGGVNISLALKKDGITFCRIGSGSLSGGYRIVCKELRGIVGSHGADVTAAYYSGEDGELVTMRIRAVAEKSL